jgi:hypothetical protein
MDVASDNSRDSRFFHLLFKVKIYEADDVLFPSLVARILEFAVPGFERLAPRKGAGSNDGRVSSRGWYYRIHGSSGAAARDAADAAATDCDGILKKRYGIRRFFLVVNDRFAGIPASVAQTLSAMRATCGLESAGALGAGDLAAHFNSLTDDQKRMITGDVPPEQPEYFDARAVGELLTRLAGLPPFPAQPPNVPPQEFNEKMQGNGLTGPIRALLTTASRQTAYIDDFFNIRGAGLKQSIAGKLHRMYRESVAAVPGSDPDAADLRFLWLSHKLVSETAGRHPHAANASMGASRAVIAGYFETCDVYEHTGSAFTE